MRRLTRRELVMKTMVAGGFLGLKSMLLGLPPSFIAQRVFAQDMSSKQFLIFSERDDGDPVNCNVPGSYSGNIWHAAHADFFNPPSYEFGTKSYQAAVPWGTLDLDLRRRLNFFHHKTLASNHPESREVLSIYGAITGESGSGSEMIASAVAQETASVLGTVQKEPISLSGLLSYNGLDLSVSKPSNLQAIFKSQTEIQKQMMNFRDQQLDLIYGDLKTNGTPAQKRFINNFATSRSQAKQLSENIIEYLSGVQGDSQDDCMKTAAALIALNAAPVIRVELAFGGDNHFDSGLEDEMAEHRSGTASMNLLWNELKKYNIQDKVTFAMLNVFGRTLKQHGQGRGHNGDHNVMVTFGSKISGGVIGGLDSQNKAAGINSTTGLTANPDVTPDVTHHSAAKSLMSAVGIQESKINSRIASGKIVRSFIKS